MNTGDKFELRAGTGTWTGGDLIIRAGNATGAGVPWSDRANEEIKLRCSDGQSRFTINESGFVRFNVKRLVVDDSMCIKCRTAKKRLSGCAGAYEYDGLCWSCFGP